VCLIRETKKTRSVGVPPGTGLGNTELRDTVYWIKGFIHDIEVMNGRQITSFSAQFEDQCHS